MSATYTALLRIAPLVGLERVNSETWKQPRTMYDYHALSFLPGKDSCPVVANHDHDRVVGRVTAFVTWEDETGAWTAAIADIHDAPVWLSKDTKCSFSYASGRTSRDFFGCEIVRRGYVREVTVLSPDRTPAEPLARVVGLRRSAAGTTELAADADPIPGDGQTVTRYCGTVIGVR